MAPQPSKDAIQRSYLLRHLTRLEKHPERTLAERYLLKDLKAWIKSETKRAARPGGLGR